MIIYNVTVKISNEKHDEWVSWMKTAHIPDVMKTGVFSKYVFSKVLIEDDEGTNYSIQYYCDNMDILTDYQNNMAPKLQVEHAEKFRDHFVAFRTLLEII